MIAKDRLFTRHVTIGMGIGGPLELWDTQTGRLVRRFDLPDSDPWSYRFIADGRWVALLNPSGG
jgi:hypothetical protein